MGETGVRDIVVMSRMVAVASVLHVGESWLPIPFSIRFRTVSVYTRILSQFLPLRDQLQDLC